MLAGFYYGPKGFGSEFYKFFVGVEGDLEDPVTYSSK